MYAQHVRALPAREPPKLHSKMNDGLSVHFIGRRSMVHFSAHHAVNPSTALADPMK
jgi:hypothetical protein